MRRPWVRTLDGWTMQDAGGRWRIRGPIMGKRRYWLYRNASRVSRIGTYEDACTFASVAAAKAYVAALSAPAKGQKG